MSIATYRKRWRTAEGMALRDIACEWLLGGGGRHPSGLSTIDGRVDLRGLEMPSPKIVGRFQSDGLSLGVADGLHSLENAVWENLDLSGARLPGFRFHGSLLRNTLLDSADCTDWRLWGTVTEGCSFAGGSLKGASLGTGQEYGVNAWDQVSFVASDLRDVSLEICTFRHCDFTRARLNGAEFKDVSFAHVRFSGELKDVIFDGRGVWQGRPVEPMTCVDFRGSSFRDVTFWGYEFFEVTLPEVPGLRLVQRYPEVARRAVEILSRTHTDVAKVLTAAIEDDVTMPERSVAVFNRADLVDLGGEPMADLLDEVLDQAEAG